MARIYHKAVMNYEQQRWEEQDDDGIEELNLCGHTLFLSFLFEEKTHGEEKWWSTRQGNKATSAQINI